MRYIGMDLAWGERARTGVAELDARGRIIGSASVRSDDEIAEFLGAHVAGCVAAIDAPLIVPNESGQRPCEHDMGRLFGRYHASAYPANRGNPAFVPEPRGARLSERFGWVMDPGVRPDAHTSVAIEVYPHSAMVSTFGLERVIPYKARRGRDVAFRRKAFTLLLDRMESTCAPLRLTEYPRWGEIRDVVANAGRHVDLNRVEDEVDGIMCSYVAWLWGNDPESMLVLGDAASGYIVTPFPPVVGEQGVYILDPQTGVVRFGNGTVGVRPASGDRIGANYRTGGGAAGNVTP